MLNKTPNKTALLAILSLTLVAALGLGGCGSLANTTAPPPASSAEPKTLSNLLRTGDTYSGIEIFHGTPDEPKYTPDNHGYLYEKDGWIYLHISGEPAELGYQHGWLLADYIQNAIDLNRQKLKTTQGVEWDYLKENALRIWSQKINPEYVTELQGIVKGAAERGATFDYGDLVTWNGFEELSEYWLPKHLDEYYQSLPVDKGMTNVTSGSGIQLLPVDATAPADDLVSPDADVATSDGTLSDAASNATAATATENNGADDRGSAFIATGSYTTDGAIVLAHNTSAKYEDANFLNVSIDVTPKAGQHFAMQSQPGYIHSMSDIYTSATLLVSKTTSGGFASYAENGIPEFNRIRQAVQYATTLDEFVETMIYGNNGGYANAWLVGQLDSKEIMQLELGLKFYNVQKTADGAFAGLNAPEDARIRNLETTDSGFADIRRHQGASQVRILQLLELNKGNINAEVAKAIITDHYDVYLEKINPSARTICSHYELDKREYEGDSNSSLPYQPRGAVDGTIVSSELSGSYTILARWGSSCGKAFDSTEFFEKHAQFNYLKPYIFDRPTQAWTELTPIQYN